jgi:hypothetical protein
MERRVRHPLPEILSSDESAGLLKKDFTAAALSVFFGNAGHRRFELAARPMGGRVCTAQPRFRLRRPWCSLRTGAALR